MEPCFSPCDKNRMTREERMLQIDELDEWQKHVKEKSRIHDTEQKRPHDEHVDGTNPVKVGDKLNTSGSTLFMVLNVFPNGTVKVTHSKFDTFKVNITRLKPYFDNRIDSEKEEFRLCEPP
ncbi:hypothetical protein GOBAR_AA05544 [Gossypium barbadense]|uniref:Uncharacterized protein n=1 Tax=Gossypium barbadense TaxID=3634 RepID=A0A2P5YHF5_GOSBA|nr:hypothetical protein GOBAR_AA05544 [Gossypium barbadense]